MAAAEGPKKTDIISKRNAAIVASVVGGAAASTSDWMYDCAGKIAALKGKESAPEFLEKSASPFYTVELGQQSMFGHELLQLIGHVTSNRGTFDQAKYMDHAQAYVTARQKDGTFGDIEEQKDQANWPVKGAWQHHTVLDALARHAEGAAYPQGQKDAQVDGAAKAVALGALLAGQEGLATAVEQATRSVQDDDLAVAAAMVVARAVEAGVTGAAGSAAEAVRAGLDAASKDLPKASEAVKQVADDVTLLLQEPSAEAAGAGEPEAAEDDPDAAYGRGVEGAPEAPSHYADVTLKRGGGGCSVPRVAALGLSAAAAPASRFGKGLEEYAADGASEPLARLRATLYAPGASAARSIIAGGLLGAVHGDGFLPKSWLERTQDLEAVRGQLEEMDA